MLAADAMLSASFSFTIYEFYNIVKNLLIDLLITVYCIFSKKITVYCKLLQMQL
jgi:hypothetical protein